LSWGTQAALLLTPYLAGTLLLLLVPALLTLALAFTGYDTLTPPVWRGLQNFVTLARDVRVGQAFQNTLIYVALAVPLRVAAALALALWLQGRRPGAGWVRAAVYVPSVVPPVAYALAGLWLLNPLYGPVNLALGALGLPAPAWLAEAGPARVAVALLAVFQIGEGFVVLLAARRGLSPEVLAAATVDGAGAWATFRYIVRPLLQPWLVLLTLRDVALSFQNAFAAAYLMTGGGPYYATLFLPLLAHEEAFGGFRYGEAAALMLAALVTAAALIAVFWALWRGWGGAEEW